MAGHLPAAAVRIFRFCEIRRASSPQCHADGQHKGVIPVIGQIIILFTVKRECRADLGGFLADAGYVEFDFPAR